jgi:hypothetical protein
MSAALYGAIILLPLYYQLIRGLAPIDTGLLLAPTGLGVALISRFSSRLSARLGPGLVILLGVTGTLAASLPMTQINATTSYYLISVTMFVRGLGIGVIFGPGFEVAFLDLRDHEISDASPQLNLLQLVAGSTGMAVLAVVLQRPARTQEPPTRRPPGTDFGLPTGRQRRSPP